MKSVINAKSIKTYITKKEQNELSQNLLATMSVNQLRDAPYISVPRVTVGTSLRHAKMSMEKLPGMYDIEGDRGYKL